MAAGNLKNKGTIKRVIRLAALAAVSYVFVCIIVYLAQDRLVYFPDRMVSGNPSSMGLAYENVKFSSADRVGLSGWFVPAPSSRGTILFCHGNAGKISNRLDSIKIFIDMGFSLFIFDYRGFGESGGSPSEEGLYRDADAAWGYLVDKRGVAPKDIVIFGRSLGGGVAANLASRVKPRALILESTFTSLLDVGGERYPFLPVRILSRNVYNTVDVLPGISAPLLIIHSKEDEVVPYVHGQRLFSLANEPKLFVEISGGHNDGYQTSGDTYKNALQSFLLCEE